MAFSREELTLDKFLDGAVSILQPRNGFRAGADSVLIAASVPAVKGDSVLDLGCGAGTSILCLCNRVPNLDPAGLEIQPDYADLAHRNASLNGVALDILEGSVSNPPARLKSRGFDQVLANPPYFRLGGGASAKDEGREIAQFETTPLSTWVDCAMRRLKPGGWLTMILIAERFPALAAALADRAGSVAAKPVCPRSESEAGRLLIRARKGSKGRFRLLAPLVLHQEEPHIEGGTRYTSEAADILRGGAAVRFS